MTIDTSALEKPPRPPRAADAPPYRDMPAESAEQTPVEQGIVAAPGLADPHAQVEVDAPPERGLQLLARGRADGLDHPAAGPDQDGLLGLTLGPQVGLDLEHPVLALLHLPQLDLHGVGELVAGA